MPVPGYSNNPAYPHPSNGSSYVIMPGNNSHLTPGGVKYGIQQFKPVPAGSPAGFGNFAGPTGYTVNTPGVVGSTPGHEDTSRLKYKDSLYVPNPQVRYSSLIFFYRGCCLVISFIRNLYIRKKRCMHAGFVFLMRELLVACMHLSVPDKIVVTCIWAAPLMQWFLKLKITLIPFIVFFINGILNINVLLYNRLRHLRFG